ncbi:MULTISPECIES: RNA polymerase sigma factor SigJ [Streptomyces]|jgi:RNA polymerase sigma-70 factor (ECF subfamily)|uniref:RNA polymerase sigma factor SigJ n=1 Tax=Streptomyces mirabilis TaxID=68239 RepID=A0ABU3UDU2_9ACTN|nr:MULTISPECIES: RNA polymerase sigma factor SigJ [Streptomyces]MCX4427305.1 RNA polymerase sigma factor SigJ [Streptomyces mirabilis]MCX4614205.1 RNA polymerase sigma factor SigJ [Streptomyces mirabilis]MCX5354332.1 RNA polymerase sigma factor SigJ [Streptomyces mirabilis]MDU8992088.1 RNA polymerase sigma factor SigJ [Streptomyces mirabilis]QDN92217.1 sigma-70 family RNA polymerase sigma factor [Streptomyces sp. RLB3-6]
MDDDELLEHLADRFQEHRGRLRAVAYRMLGSLSEADDAVQEVWLKLGRTDVGEIRNLAGWLTTVVGRVCLDLLRTRAARREEPLDTYVPDPLVSPLERIDPEQEVLLADSVGLALLVVLETLEPAERLAFVLHDMFAVPFDDIAPVVGRSSAATRQLASRARRRVRGAAAPEPELDPARQKLVLDAFLAASRAGDFEALVSVLHPDVVLRVDSGVLVGGAAASKVVHGATGVAQQALMFRQFAEFSRLALVNGAVGVVTAPEGRPLSVMGVTITDGRVVEMYILADPARLSDLALPDLPG